MCPGPRGLRRPLPPKPRLFAATGPQRPRSRARPAGLPHRRPRPRPPPPRQCTHGTLLQFLQLLSPRLTGLRRCPPHPTPHSRGKVLWIQGLLPEVCRTAACPWPFHSLVNVFREGLWLLKGRKSPSLGGCFLWGLSPFPRRGLRVLDA